MGKMQSQPERDKRWYWDQHHYMLCQNTKWWDNNLISKIVPSSQSNHISKVLSYERQSNPGIHGPLEIYDICLN